MRFSITLRADGSRVYEVNGREVDKRTFDRVCRDKRPDYANGECPRVAFDEDYTHLNNGRGYRNPQLAKSIFDHSDDCYVRSWRDLERKAKAKGLRIEDQRAGGDAGQDPDQ